MNRSKHGLTLVTYTISCLLLTSTANGQAQGGDPIYTDVLNVYLINPQVRLPGASRAGSGVQFYSATQFSVDTTGPYSFESTSINSAGTPSNAMDTFIVLYADSFDPNNPDTDIASNNDFTGTFTILPGPFAGDGVRPTSTGSIGAQPGSRIPDFTLAAGTQYWLINSSFRDTTFVSTTTAGQAVGTVYTAINGPGALTVVPEPGSLTLLGIAGLGFVFRRRRAKVFA